MPIMWSPISRPETHVDACERAIRDAILAGELTPGARLPPERALADELGVNRVTVRSALGRLRGAGLLEVRQGSGHTVRAWRETGGPELLTSLAALDNPTIDRANLARDLLHVRRHLARAVLEHIAALDPSPDTVGVEEAIAIFAKAAEAGQTDALAAADLGVLRAIVAASGSPVLQLVLNPITDVVMHFDALREALYAEPMTNLEGWRGLLSWLRAPSADTLPLIFQAMAHHDEQTAAKLLPPPS